MNRDFNIPTGGVNYSGLSSRESTGHEPMFVEFYCERCGAPSSYQFCDQCKDEEQPLTPEEETANEETNSRDDLGKY